jgi:hypothetical protein
LWLFGVDGWDRCGVKGKLAMFSNFGGGKGFLDAAAAAA